jgi:hypothetical protein
VRLDEKVSTKYRFDKLLCRRNAFLQKTFGQNIFDDLRVDKNAFLPIAWDSSSTAKTSQYRGWADVVLM